jgi:hypothetical protein
MFVLLRDHLLVWVHYTALCLLKRFVFLWKRFAGDGCFFWSPSRVGSQVVDGIGCIAAHPTAREPHATSPPRPNTPQSAHLQKIQEKINKNSLHRFTNINCLL